MAFNLSSEIFAVERAARVSAKDKLLRFGCGFADDSLLGIRPEDLVLIGAPSGVGKTQFCVNLALTNIEDGKRVHFFALEAGEYEIERRIKFQILAQNFYGDPNRPQLGRPLLFDEWEIGQYDDALAPYEDWADKYCADAFKNLYTFYKLEEFTVERLIELVMSISSETDLICIDHTHYFDWEDSNDNRALKEIAKKARDLVRFNGVPIVLVAHLRKRDRNARELCAGLDEFHGSSDLTKIATKVITLAPGGPAEGGGYYTYVRTPKNRHSGSSSRFLAQMIFNERRGGYEQQYRMGWANAEEFGELELGKYPSWFGRKSGATTSGSNYPSDTGRQSAYEKYGRSKNSAPGARQNTRD